MELKNTLIAIGLISIGVYFIIDLIKNPFYKRMIDNPGDRGYSILRTVIIILGVLSMGLLILYHEYFGEGFVW